MLNCKLNILLKAREHFPYKWVLAVGVHEGFRVQYPPADGQAEHNDAEDSGDDVEHDDGAPQSASPTRLVRAIRTSMDYSHNSRDENKPTQPGSWRIKALK